MSQAMALSSTEPPKRVYIQYQPDSDSRQALLKLQGDVLRLNPAARPMPAEELHITIIHFGIAEEVYNHLKLVAPELTPDRFNRSLELFIQDCEAACPPRINCTFDRYDLFGAKRNVLVLTALPDQAMQQAHTDSLNALRTMLRDCGVPETDAWMAADHNFQFALSLKPHITLLRNGTVLPPAAPHLSAQLALSPTRYDLKKTL